MRVVFFIQAEGRGHMTQALALKRILEDAGHEVAAAFMGENPERPVPSYFSRRFRAPLHKYLAPVFVIDRKGKGVRPWDSFFQALRRFPRYWAQGPRFHRELSAYRPDLLVNFYDLLGGMYSAIYRPAAPVVAVGHQFLFFHPAFRIPPGEGFQVAMIKFNTQLTSLNARLKLGLSFSPLPDLPDQRIRVVPPLLRDEVLRADPEEGGHLLAYVLNPGYSEELKAWHKRQSDIDLHCFWDRVDAPPAHSPWEGLTFHRLDDTRFIDLLRTCRGFASTAGFESVCEAAYLGKPISLVPTGKHVEQLCNALDAERAGLAQWRRDFDLTDFVAGLAESDPAPRSDFREWVRAGPDAFLTLLEAVARGDPVLNKPLALSSVRARTPK